MYFIFLQIWSLGTSSSTFKAAENIHPASYAHRRLLLHLWVIICQRAVLGNNYVIMPKTSDWARHLHSLLQLASLSRPAGLKQLPPRTFQDLNIKNIHASHFFCFFSCSSLCCFIMSWSCGADDESVKLITRCKSPRIEAINATLPRQQGTRYSSCNSTHMSQHQCLVISRLLTLLHFDRSVEGELNLKAPTADRARKSHMMSQIT